MPIVVERFAKGPVASYPYTEKTVREMEQGIKFFWGTKLGRFLFG
jgi:hypothetical protein